MPKQRKEYKSPKKLTAFFSLPGITNSQYGAGGACKCSAQLSSPSPGQEFIQTTGTSSFTDDQGESSLPYSPSTVSPAKSRLRTTGPEHTQPSTASCLFSLPSPQQSLVLVAFPTSDQPLSEQTMKSMLLSLRQYTDLSTTVSSLSVSVQQHDKHFNTIESRVGDMYTADKDMVDAVTDHEDQLQHIQLNLADLEDRS